MSGSTANSIRSHRTSYATARSTAPEESEVGRVSSSGPPGPPSPVDSRSISPGRALPRPRTPTPEAASTVGRVSAVAAGATAAVPAQDAASPSGRTGALSEQLVSRLKPVARAAASVAETLADLTISPGLRGNAVPFLLIGLQQFISAGFGSRQFAEFAQQGVENKARTDIDAMLLSATALLGVNCVLAAAFLGMRYGPRRRLADSQAIANARAGHGNANPMHATMYHMFNVVSSAIAVATPAAILMMALQLRKGPIEGLPAVDKAAVAMLLGGTIRDRLFSLPRDALKQFELVYVGTPEAERVAKQLADAFRAHEREQSTAAGPGERSRRPTWMTLPPLPATPEDARSEDASGPVGLTAAQQVAHAEAAMAVHREREAARGAPVDPDAQALSMAELAPQALRYVAQEWLVAGLLYDRASAKTAPGADEAAFNGLRATARQVLNTVPEWFDSFASTYLTMQRRARNQRMEPGELRLMVNKDLREMQGLPPPTSVANVRAGLASALKTFKQLWRGFDVTRLIDESFTRGNNYHLARWVGFAATLAAKGALTPERIPDQDTRDILQSMVVNAALAGTIGMEYLFMIPHNQVMSMIRGKVMRAPLPGDEESVEAGREVFEVEAGAVHIPALGGQTTAPDMTSVRKRSIQDPFDLASGEERRGSVWTRRPSRLPPTGWNLQVWGGAGASDGGSQYDPFRRRSTMLDPGRLRVPSREVGGGGPGPGTAASRAGWGLEARSTSPVSGSPGPQSIQLGSILRRSGSGSGSRAHSSDPPRVSFQIPAEPAPAAEPRNPEDDPQA